MEELYITEVNNLLSPPHLQEVAFLFPLAELWEQRK